MTNQFRAAVMAEISEAHKMTNGSTPDHIIVSEAIWRDLDDLHKFEKLAEEKRKEWREENVGYLGMHVWKCSALDKREKAALLVSDDVFRSIVTIE